ncbi:cytochrome C [Aliidiomarina sedimenti]|uniref:Cytochrome C n=2 Tax=Aliidiomarina sedimenti TaxID=1933879 RepID=A0ABY0C0X2_9GAMM|nr:cytochrome c5 family protein [Aliidiomarina sedimenti]RUO30994.1 cytochrome C [Aliidiomarina sedimenti]
MAAGMAIAGGVAVAQDMSEDSIAERIKPAGQVRMAGESSAAQSAGSSEPRSGEEVYNQACSACHAGGVLGAPKKGNAGDWEERIAKGMDVLLDHSINGFNAMPPRGGCGACSDEEIEAAVEHMIAGL